MIVESQWFIARRLQNVLHVPSLIDLFGISEVVTAYLTLSIFPITCRLIWTSKVYILRSTNFVPRALGTRLEINSYWWYFAPAATWSPSLFIQSTFSSPFLDFLKARFRCTPSTCGKSTPFLSVAFSMSVHDGLLKIHWKACVFLDTSLAGQRTN